MSLNYFSDATVSDGTYVTSTLDTSALVSAIQAYSPDTYFDATSKIGEVFVYYTHEDNRQVKRIIHDATAHQGSVYWSTNARDGTWQKNRILAFDTDGAQRELPRSAIGTAEDATHTSGKIYLNVS